MLDKLGNNIPARINGKDNPEYTKIKRQNPDYREKSNNRTKKWVKKHKEYIKIERKKYYKENKLRISKKQKLYREKNRNEILEIQKKYYQINKEYFKEKSRQYGKTHKEEKKNYNKQWWLNNRNILLMSSKLNNNEKRIRCNKRHYPLDNKCELCNSENKKLAYHHWDNEHLEFGVWICNSSLCHWLAESVDNPKFEEIKNKYLNLKMIIQGKPYIL